MPLAHAYHVWLTSVNVFVSQPDHRQTEWQTDRRRIYRITPPICNRLKWRACEDIRGVSGNVEVIHNLCCPQGAGRGATLATDGVFRARLLVQLTPSPQLPRPKHSGRQTCLVVAVSNTSTNFVSEFLVWQSMRGHPKLCRDNDSLHVWVSHQKQTGHVSISRTFHSDAKPASNVFSTCKGWNAWGTK